MDDSSDAVCNAIPLPDSQILSLSLFTMESVEMWL
jgi:hypothetical protein